jgi:hexosaminidase
MIPLLLLALLFLSLQGTYALWPQPSKLQTGTSALRLAPNTTFKIIVDVANPPADLLAAVRRTHAYLFTDDLARLVPSHGAEDLPALSHSKALPGLTLRLQSQGETGEGYGVVSREIALEARTYILLRQEEYTLDVPADGTEAVLSAASTLGLFRGLNTFAQLWYTYDGREALDQDCDGKVVYTLSAPVAIQDSPAYVSVSVLFLSLGMLTWAWMDTAVALPWVHAGHGAEFVSNHFMDCREIYDHPCPS